MKKIFTPALWFFYLVVVAQPPAPAVAGPDREAQLSGDAPGRTGATPQKGGQHPMRQRPLAPMRQSSGEVVAGALATMAPGAFAAGAVLVSAPLFNVVALAARTWQRTIFPPEPRDVRLALFGVAEVVYMGAHQHS